MTEAAPTAAGAGLPDFRRMPVPEAIAWLSAHGEPPDPRPDIDTASLERRFPHLARVQTRDLATAGARGDVPMRVYRDPSAPATGAALVWVHGGAFIGGHLDMPESNWVARELASRGIPVLAVDYSKCLSGIHFPVPADDVLAAWRFAAARAEELLGVPARALALGGASAGSTLAAGVVTTLVAAGEDVPAGLVLVYPVLHPNGPGASRDLDLDSPHGQLTLNYAGSEEALDDPRAFPGLGDGAGFPRTLVLVCEQDPLLPSGEVFAATLRAADRPVDLVVEEGAAHGHIDHPGDEGAVRSLRTIAAWMTGDAR